MRRALRNLDAIVSKPDRTVGSDDNSNPATVIQARLHPNVGPFVFQIRTATGTATGAAARLADRRALSLADDQEAFAEEHERLGKAREHLASFASEDFDGADSKRIALNLGPGPVRFTGASLLLNFAMPTFFFHLATADNTLPLNDAAIDTRRSRRDLR